MGAAVHDATADPPSPLRSVHTTSFAHLLHELGVSLVVSTYQAGKLVMVRADGGQLNTHFRAFTKPMGLAYRPGRMSVGGSSGISEFRDMPDVAAKLEPAGRHDACFLPRSTHFTGDIDIHEMAFAGDELWFVNTRFSCLCTIQRDYSFVPCWWPKFVTGLAPEDRCHLNGLGLYAGRPKFVTALGATDTAQGWRANKSSGGVVIDIQTGATLLNGLSMPHSPRWYAGKLWLLESGTGRLAHVRDYPARLEVVAELPGFTRGLDFCGSFAFVGLSQVRESAVFSGIPITERLTERTCGVWVVDIRSGQTVAFLRFEDAVQEVFAVQVLPAIRFPELLVEGDERIGSSYVLPDDALRLVPGRFAA